MTGIEFVMTSAFTVTLFLNLVLVSSQSKGIGTSGPVEYMQSIVSYGKLYFLSDVYLTCSYNNFILRQTFGCQGATTNR